MPEDKVTELLAEALRDLALFLEERPDDATADDDVRALESLAYVLNQATSLERDRLRSLLGPELVEMLGWD